MEVYVEAAIDCEGEAADLALQNALHAAHLLCQLKPEPPTDRCQHHPHLPTNEQFDSERFEYMECMYF